MALAAVLIVMALPPAEKYWFAAWDNVRLPVPSWINTKIPPCPATSSPGSSNTRLPVNVHTKFVYCDISGATVPLTLVLVWVLPTRPALIVMAVPVPASDAILSKDILPTLVMFASPKDVAPKVTEPVVDKALEPISMLPNPDVI